MSLLKEPLQQWRTKQEIRNRTQGISGIWIQTNRIATNNLAGEQQQENRREILVIVCLGMQEMGQR